MTGDVPRCLGCGQYIYANDFWPHQCGGSVLATIAPSPLIKHLNALLSSSRAEEREACELLRCAEKVLPLLHDERYRGHWETITQFEAAISAIRARATKG